MGSFSNEVWEIQFGKLCTDGFNCINEERGKVDSI